MAARWSSGLLVRFPALYPRLSRAVMRMSERRRRTAIAYVAKRAYAAYNRRDWELNTLPIDPDRYVLTWGDDDRWRPPDARDAYHGLEGYIEFAELWLEKFDDFRFELVEIAEAAPDRIVLVLGQTAVAGGVDLVIEEQMIDVHDLHDGRTVGQTVWRNRSAAFAALGLRAQDG